MTGSPVSVAIDARSGRGLGFEDHYVKSFAEVADIYQDQAAAARIDSERVAYEVYSTARIPVSGALVFGTSIVSPGQVGDEFSMTRGHLHSVVDRAEIYHCLAGTGVLLMEDHDGRTDAKEISPGNVVYVPGGWIHRSVNVGSEPLVTLFCFAADAGQDYAVIGRSRGMAALVVADGAGGWDLRPNPAYVRRSDETRP